MQSKLDEYIREYKRLTLEQKKAIEKQSIDILDNLILDKKDVINKINYLVNSNTEINNKTKQMIKEIISIEKENANQLKLNQQSIRKKIEYTKIRRHGINSYIKNNI